MKKLKEITVQFRQLLKQYLIAYFEIPKNNSGKTTNFSCCLNGKFVFFGVNTCLSKEDLEIKKDIEYEGGVYVPVNNYDDIMIINKMFADYRFNRLKSIID